MPINYCIAVALENIDPTLTVPNVVFDNESVVSGTTAIAAIEATWDPPTNPYVIGIQFEWCPLIGSPKTSEMQSTTDGVLHWKTTNGIAPKKKYSCRWRAYSADAYGVWSTPVIITTLPNVTSEALIGILWEMEVNLWRFDHLLPEHGAVALGTWPTDPYTTFGDQGRAWSLPGTDPLVALRRIDTKAITPQDNNAHYSYGLTGKVDSGTATLSMAYFVTGTDTLFPGDWMIGGVVVPGGIHTLPLTTTATVLKIEDVTSDDVDWINADLKFFFDSGDISSGQTATLTDLMLHYHERKTGVGFRPSPDEDWVLYYAEQILEVQQAYVLSHPGRRLQSNVQGTGHKLTPFGISGSRQIGGDSTFTSADVGGYVWSDSGSDLLVYIEPYADRPIDLDAVLVASRKGTGKVTITGGAGVTVVPNGSGSLEVEEGEIMQLLHVDYDVWHAV